MPSTKRPRSAADENRAECPFSVQTRPLTAAEQHQNAKKRKGEGHDEDRRSEWQSQAWPYAPIGKMKNNDALDVKYSVSPHVDWQAMTRYNSFVRKSPHLPSHPQLPCWQHHQDEFLGVKPQ